MDGDTRALFGVGLIVVAVLLMWYQRAGSKNRQAKWQSDMDRWQKEMVDYNASLDRYENLRRQSPQDERRGG